MKIDFDHVYMPDGVYQIVDTEPEQAFDDLAQLAASLCRTPIALVSLIVASLYVWLRYFAM